MQKDMSKLITKSVLNKIKKRAIEVYPNEACGLIINPNPGVKSSFVACANIAGDPNKRFVISPKEFASAEDLGTVVAVWHTHVEHSSAPSDFDINSCNESELEWFILDIYKRGDSFEFGTVKHIEPNLSEVDLIGRPYIYGVYDCFSLAKNYYRKEMGIDIDFVPPGYPEVCELSNQKNLLLVEGAAQAGFERVSTQLPKKGDLIILNVCSDYPNHIAVYVGDLKILHHCMGRLSELSIYPGSYWEKHTFAHMRYKGLM